MPSECLLKNKNNMLKIQPGLINRIVELRSLLLVTINFNLQKIN